MKKLKYLPIYLSIIIKIVIKALAFVIRLAKKETGVNWDAQGERKVKRDL